jgi:hypothetical protein
MSSSPLNQPWKTNEEVVKFMESMKGTDLGSGRHHYYKKGETMHIGGQSRGQQDGKPGELDVLYDTEQAREYLKRG